MENARKVAFFDFDGTIIREDSFVEFLKFYGGSWRFYLCLFWNAFYIVLFYLKAYPNHRLKERFFSFYFKGVNVQDVAEKGSAFASTVLPGMLLEQAMALIKWHKENGHKVYLLTASSSIWLKPWCEVVGISFIGTEFEVVNECYSGALLGKNCYGQEKLARIADILEETEYSYGYGDSSADLFYLNAVNEGFQMCLDAKGIGRNKVLSERIQGAATN